MTQNLRARKVPEAASWILARSSGTRLKPSFRTSSSAECAREKSQEPELCRETRSFPMDHFDVRIITSGSQYTSKPHYSAVISFYLKFFISDSGESSPASSDDALQRIRHPTLPRPARGGDVILHAAAPDAAVACQIYRQKIFTYMTWKRLSGCRQGIIARLVVIATPFASPFSGSERYYRT